MLWLFIGIFKFITENKMTNVDVLWGHMNLLPN